MSTVKYILLSIFPALLIISCQSTLDYDISSADPVPVLNALWSAADSEHAVYICTSNAYNVSETEETAHIYCYVNGKIAAETEDYTIRQTSSKIDLKEYIIKTDLSAGDHVRIIARFPDKELSAEAVVPPAPCVRIDTTSVADDFNYGGPVVVENRRDYSITMTLDDNPGKATFYRLYSPNVHSEVHRVKDDSLVEKKDWLWFPFDEKDPVFKNVTVEFPFEIMLEFPFLSGTVNATHVFSDELFADNSHSLFFELSQDKYDLSIWHKRYCDISMRFRLASLSREEYLYLVAANAATASFADPMAEPVVLPYNVSGGLGFFGIENVYDRTILLKRCYYYDPSIGEMPIDGE